MLNKIATKTTFLIFISESPYKNLQRTIFLPILLNYTDIFDKVNDF